jgi:DNA repair protein RadC
MNVRERIAERGIGTLSDTELLCALLRTGPQGVLRLSEALLKKFGGLRGVMEARSDDLGQIPGLGSAKISELLAVAEIRRRLTDARPAGTPNYVRNGESAFRLFRRMQAEDQEVVWAAFLTTRNRVIRVCEIFRGTVGSAPAQPREILRSALRANAAKLIVAHNHPSGEIVPSDDDQFFTDELEFAARTVGVPLIDHLIVGGETYFSFAEAKRLGRWRRGLGRKSDGPGPDDPCRTI